MSNTAKRLLILWVIHITSMLINHPAFGETDRKELSELAGKFCDAL